MVCAGSHTNLADRRSHRVGTFSTSEQHRRGSSTCAVNPSATTCVHWRCIISTQNMFHLIKKDICMHIYMHECHFGNFPGDNSNFHICKRVCREVWGRNGWHMTFTNHFQKGFAQQVSNTLNAGKSYCKLQEKENVWTSVYFIFITLPLKASVYTILILFKPQKSMGFAFSFHKYSPSICYLTYTFLGMETRDKKQCTEYLSKNSKKISLGSKKTYR